MKEVPNDLKIERAQEIIENFWLPGGLIIIVGAIGAATRLISSKVSSKEDDPAVLVLDANAKNIIPLLGGHKGGAEDLSLQIAESLGGNAVITSDSNSQERIAIDLLKHLQ